MVVIGTPVDEFLGPSMTIFERTVDQIAPHLREGALVVLRSTVYPGTTAYVAQHLAARGCRVDVAFCPERIAEGHALEELHTLPQIVGADTERAAERAEALFGRARQRRLIRTTTKEAELAKLFTNTWRYMKFAVANQFFMIADQAGVDYTNVLHAIRHDYPRAADLPGPGFAAGPCLFKDTMQLAAFTTDHFPMGQAAMQVNEGLPAYIVSALERRYGALRRQDASGSSGWPSRPSRTTRGRRSATSSASCSPGPARRSCARTRTSRTTGSCRSTRVIAESDVLVLGVAAQRLPRPRRRRQATSSTSGARWARGSGSSEGPRHRRRGVHQRLPRPGAARGRPRGRRARQLQQVRPAREVVRRPSRATGSSRATPRTPTSSATSPRDCDQVVAAAAMIGGISYFHEFAYDLLAENERILASTFDAAIAAHRDGHAGADRRAVSSSMVYESATVFPTPEGAQLTSPPPISTYGFQKLASEYFAKGAWEQYQLPYTIVRPFNCVGIGERRAVRDTDVMSGNVKLALSHVVPDLVLKVLKGQDPLHILGDGSQVRHYTYGGDLAHGIRLAMESPEAVNDDFNLSTARSTTVLELAECIWSKVHGRRAAVPLRLRPAVRARRPAPRARHPQGAARSSATRPRPRSRRCSTRSSRGSARRSRRAAYRHLQP